MGDIPILGQKPKRPPLDFSHPEEAVPKLEVVYAQLTGILASIAAEQPVMKGGLRITEIVTPDFLAMIEQMQQVTFYGRQASILVASIKMEAGSRMTNMFKALELLAVHPDGSVAKIAADAIATDQEMKARYNTALIAALKSGSVAQPLQPGETPH